MHMGILYLSNWRSSPGFPFYKMKACVVARLLCSTFTTEQIKHTGSRCTELWSFQINSVTDLQKLTLQKNHIHVILFCLPCERQTPKQRVTCLSCADRILNATPQQCGDASEGAMTRGYESVFSVPSSTSAAHSWPPNKSRKQARRVNKSTSGQIETLLFILILYFPCTPPGC